MKVLLLINDVNYIFVTSSDGMVISITVQLTDTEIEMKLKRQTFQHRYTYEGSFSIFSAYAITGHKLQGATITSNVLVNIRHAFSPGPRANIFYVIPSDKPKKLEDQRNPIPYRLHSMQSLNLMKKHSSPNLLCPLFQNFLEWLGHLEHF